MHLLHFGLKNSNIYFTTTYSYLCCFPANNNGNFSRSLLNKSMEELERANRLTSLASTSSLSDPVCLAGTILPSVFA